MQIAVALDHLCSWAQPQMKGVAENDLRTNGLHIARQHALDGTVGTHRHERWGLDSATRKGQTPAAGLAISGKQLERHMAGASHCFSSGPRGAGLRVMNMASP